MKDLKPRDLLLSVQHLFAMFGATVLVPLITGLNPSLALFSAGIGTLIFHLCTKFKVPVFLGSSFAFLAALTAVIRPDGSTIIPENIPLAQGGIIFAGVVYLIFALIAYFIGAEQIKRIFPPIVTGPIIVIIGINLAGTAFNDALGGADISAGMTGQAALNLGIALFTLLVVICCSIFAKGLFKLIPILIGIISGYVLCIILQLAGVFSMDFSAITAASWINIPFKTLDANGVRLCHCRNLSWASSFPSRPSPSSHLWSTSAISPPTGTVVGKNFLEDPGLHRTL